MENRSSIFLAHPPELPRFLLVKDQPRYWLLKNNYSRTSALVLELTPQ
jgi:hypothetical protein